MKSPPTETETAETAEATPALDEDLIARITKRVAERLLATASDSE